MNGSLSQFKATLQRSKERKEKRNSKFSKKGLNNGHINDETEYDFPKLRKAELDRLKSDIRKRLRVYRLKKYTLLTSIFLLIGLLFVYLFNL